MSSNLTEEQVDDIHLLMSIAILCGQRGVGVDTLPVFDAWEKAFPKDAMADIGRGLYMISNGNADDGYARIRKAAENSETRADQAHAVLASLAESLPQFSD